MSGVLHTGRNNESGLSFRFPRTENLKSRKLIRSLFDPSETETRSVSARSVRVLYRLIPEEENPVQGAVLAGFAVGRIVGNAVRRNRVRRILRECYRLEKQPLQRTATDQKNTLIMMILVRQYVAHEDQLRDDLSHVLKKLRSRIEHRPTSTDRSLEKQS